MIKLLSIVNNIETILMVEDDGFRQGNGEIHMITGCKRYKIETNGDSKETVFLLQWADVYGNIIIDLRNYELTEIM